MMMKTNTDNRKEMIRVLSGEASAEEQDHFYGTLEQNPEKKRLFEMLEKEWVTAGDAMLYRELDIDRAWQRHKSEYLELESSNTPSQARYTLWKWAAVVVLIAGTAFFFLRTYDTKDVEVISYSTGSAEVFPVSLPDGSTVTLNENSTISYRMTESAREIAFTGEAYFEVAADAGKPFVIEMQNTYIRVIGTAFNVKTGDSSVDVLVEEGVVELGLKSSTEKMRVEAGNAARASGNVVTKTPGIRTNALAWFTRKLVFEQAPLPQVLSDVSGAYHVAFRYNDGEFQNCHLTADFSHENLADVLETLHTIFEVEFTESDGIYIVGGQGCN